MGRYYYGDIEGKFWFGVQGSNDADFFGVQGQPSGELTYLFTRDDLDAIEGGLALCRQKLGHYESTLNAYFASHNSYNEQVLVEHGVPKSRVQHLLMWYARLKLGEKILACVKESGECNFTAET